MIAWAVGGVIGALPAGVLGVRIGRRNAMLLGFGLMAVCLVALNAVTSLAQAIPLLALASASWTLPTVNGYPLFVEPVPSSQRGVLAALFLLCMALGGALGDPLNGSIFDLIGGYHPLFLMMAVYTVLAFVAVLFIPRGTGEAETGPEALRTAPLAVSEDNRRMNSINGKQEPVKNPPVEKPPEQDPNRDVPPQKEPPTPKPPVEEPPVPPAEKPPIEEPPLEEPKIGSFP